METARLFLRAGTTAFGGGDPTIAILQREFYRREWLSPDQFAIAFGLARPGILRRSRLVSAGGVGGDHGSSGPDEWCVRSVSGGRLVAVASYRNRSGHGFLLDGAVSVVVLKATSGAAWSVTVRYLCSERGLCGGGCSGRVPMAGDDHSGVSHHSDAALHWQARRASPHKVGQPYGVAGRRRTHGRRSSAAGS